MKRFIYTLSLLLGSSSIIAQDFALVYETQADDEFITVRDLIKTSSNEIVAGFDHTTADGAVSGIMKTDNEGFVLWSKTLEIPSSVEGCSFEVVEKADGNLYLWGLSKQAGGEKCAILSEINGDGEILWSKQYDFGVDFSTIYAINKLNINSAGELQMMIAIYEKVIVMKTDAEGNIIWGKISQMGPSDEGGGKNPGFEWLGIEDDGGLCASKAQNDFSLLRYSEDGELLWNKAYTISSYNHGKTIARSPNGEILVAGFLNAPVGFSYKPYIMEISDEDGTINWIKYINEPDVTFGSASHLNIDGDRVIWDFYTEFSGGVQYIVELDEDGVISKAVMSKTNLTDYNKIEIVDDKEKYIYGGTLEGAVSNGLIMRTENLFQASCLVEETTLTTTDYLDFSEVDFTPFEFDFSSQTSITATLTDLPLRAKYYCDVVLTVDDQKLNEISVYPNPSRDLIRINLSEDLLNTNFTITDLSGKEVLKNQITTTQMQIDISGLNNGQYILSIYTENDIITEKITVIK